MRAPVPGCRLRGGPGRPHGPAAGRTGRARCLRAAQASCGQEDMARTRETRQVRATFLLSRMGSYRLVLGATLVTAIVTATLTAALASFAAGALPQAIHRQLATASGTSVVVSGAVDAAIAQQDDRVVRRSMQAVFGTGAVTISSARWSDPLGLPGPARAGVTALADVAAPARIRAHVVLTAGSWPRPPSGAAPGQAGRRQARLRGSARCRRQPVAPRAGRHARTARP